MKNLINVGVIGFGYWGPNIVRNFMGIKGVSVQSICDRDAGASQKAKTLYRHVYVSRDHKSILEAKAIDVVAVVTPVSTHFELAKRALENGKHVFIEKPFTQTMKEAETLIRLAEKNRLKIMVDHVFLFTGAVRKIKELLNKNALGDLYYYDSLRASLGLFRQDVNVIWDLAAHDFSIIDYAINNKPRAISAQGVDHMGRGRENIAYITIYFDNTLITHISVNWLSPVKVRTTLIGGQKKMLVWDDLQSDEKIKVYDKGVRVKDKEGRYRILVDYRSGDMWSPRVDPTEALKVELEYFVECILRNKTPINDGKAGLRVVRMLAVTDRSLRQEGKVIKL